MTTRAWTLIDAGAYAEAEALLRGDPSEQARHARGHALTFLGRYDEARAVYGALWQQAQAQGQPEAHRYLHGLGMVEREAGDPAAALALFEQERALLERLEAGPLERAVNGYELAVNLHALGREREAHAALAGAFAQGQLAGDPMTLGRLWRAAGDFAAADNFAEAAFDAYTNARILFGEAGADAAVQEMAARLDALDFRPADAPALPGSQA